MKIIHIVHGKANPNEHNGISRVVYFLNKHEKLQGVDSEVWAIVDGVKNHFSHKRDDFVTVECFPRVYNPFGTHQIIDNLLSNKGSIDLVHFHLIWFYDKNIIAKALNKAKIPFIITTHGTYSKPHAYTGKRLLAKTMFEVDFLRRATEIHILTREEGTGLQKYGYSGKSFVAYNGIETEEIPKFRNDKFFKDKSYANKTILIWVGVLRDDKNLKSLILAFSLLPKMIRNSFTCVLVGPDYRNNASKYMRLANNLGCSDNIDYIGPLYGQDKYDAIESSDIYVMPSLSEGLSMSLLDAMACGKPSLLTSGCNMNYFHDFHVSCEPYPQDIARGLEEILSNETNWDLMGREAIHLIQSKLNWPKITKMMIDNYKRIIDSSK